jgi:small-conductance mechanosensitive channel
MPSWERAAVVGAVVLFAIVVAELVDRRIARRPLPPEAVTRYRVLRRALAASIVGIAVLSGLLVIPQVRAIAGGILASSAIVGLVVGFAARSTLANFVAGLLIALAQPLRLGDHVEVAGGAGVVEEIGLTYTLIRTPDDARLVIPNEKLASDTIRNSTIVSPERLASVSVRVPLGTDLEAVVALVREVLAGETGVEILVTALEDSVTVTLRARAAGEEAAERLASELRLRIHGRLRATGVLR